MPFTAADNQDGTVTLSIVGGAAGGVVTFFGSVINSLELSAAWGAFGGVTLNGAGAGSVTLAAASGLYIFAAVCSGTLYLNSVRCNVTDGTGCNATKTRTAVANRILSLGLPFVAVEQQWAHDESNLAFPCVVLSPGEGIAESEEQGLSLTDDVGYPVLVEIFDRQDVYDHTSLPNYELWRQTMIKAFRNQPLDEVRDNIICRIEYGSIIEANLPKYMFLMSRFLIRAVAREFRT